MSTNKTTLNRRDLLRTAGGVVVTSAVSYGQIVGANERVRLGLIGCGGRGQRVMKLFQKDMSQGVPGVLGHTVR